MQITYQKNNGCIIQRQRSTMLPYKIGDTTSMGWKVLNIEYEHNNKFYSEKDYNTILHKNKNKSLKMNRTKESFKEEFKKIVYYIMAALIINVLKSILGI